MCDLVRTSSLGPPISEAPPSTPNPIQRTYSQDEKEATIDFNRSQKRTFEEELTCATNPLTDLTVKERLHIFDRAQADKEFEKSYCYFGHYHDYQKIIIDALDQIYKFAKDKKKYDECHEAFNRFRQELNWVSPSFTVHNEIITWITFSVSQGGERQLFVSGGSSTSPSVVPSPEPIAPPVSPSSP